MLDNLLQNKARIKFVPRFLLAPVSLRQNGVGAGFVMTGAILPKGHRRADRRLIKGFQIELRLDPEKYERDLRVFDQQTNRFGFFPRPEPKAEPKIEPKK